MYTTIGGIYENGQVILQESVLSEKRMKVLVVFVEENEPALPSQAKAEQALTSELRPHFSERWQGQFKLNDQLDDARLNYLNQHYYQ